MMTPTYDLHLGPFNAIDALARQIEDKTKDLLRTDGWNHTCQTPGSYWMWEKKLPDGRTLLLNTEGAMRFARKDAEARVDPSEWKD